MAAELKPHGVAAIAMTPGYLRSESMLQNYGVTEANWRDGGKKDANFLVSETPLFVGRAVAALAADPGILEHTGQLFSSWELSRRYHFTDADGTRPDWGEHAIDFSRHPHSLLERLRNGADMQIRWLDTLSARTTAFAAKLRKGER
jgi:hypothetical protein